MQVRILCFNTPISTQRHRYARCAIFVITPRTHLQLKMPPDPIAFYNSAYALISLVIRREITEISYISDGNPLLLFLGRLNDSPPALNHRLTIFSSRLMMYLEFSFSFPFSQSSRSQRLVPFRFQTLTIQLGTCCIIMESLCLKYIPFIMRRYQYHMALFGSVCKYKKYAVLTLAMSLWPQPRTHPDHWRYQLRR